MDSASLNNLCTRGYIPDSELFFVHDIDSHETSLDLSIPPENHELSLNSELKIFSPPPLDYRSDSALPLNTPNNVRESVSFNSVAVAGNPTPPPPSTQQWVGPPEAFSFFFSSEQCDCIVSSLQIL